MVGSVAFIGLLLLMAGVEANPGPLGSPTVDGGENDIRTVLKQIGLDNYAQNFEDHMIGLEMVKQMSADDFNEIGITTIGTRIRIKDACTAHLKALHKVSGKKTSNTTEDEPNPSDRREHHFEPINAIVGIKTNVDEEMVQMKDDMQPNIDIDYKMNKRERQLDDITDTSIAGTTSPDLHCKTNTSQSTTSVDATSCQPVNIAMSPVITTPWGSGIGAVHLKQHTSLDPSLEEKTSKSVTPVVLTVRPSIQIKWTPVQSKLTGTGQRTFNTAVSNSDVSLVNDDSEKENVMILTDSAENNEQDKGVENPCGNDGESSNRVGKQGLQPVCSVALFSNVSNQSLVNEIVQDGNTTTLNVLEVNSRQADYEQIHCLHGIENSNQEEQKEKQGDTHVSFRMSRKPPPVPPKPKMEGRKQGVGNDNSKHASKYSENGPRLSSGKHDNLHALLRRMELTNRFPGKISLKDVTSIDVNDKSTTTKYISNLPWLILKRIIFVNTNARDHTVDELIHSDENVKADDGDTDELCPLDVFIAVFHCCDSFLKQLLYKKMLMCRLAVPFLYEELPSCNLIVPVWPLRPVVIEWMDSNRRSYETFILDQPTQIITFARFGRPAYSKSTLQNYLLSDNKNDTFFNIDCPLGMSDRSLSLGYLEASWYLPGGKESDVFDEVLTFVNIRGDLLNDFSELQLKFLQQLANISVIVLDANTLLNQISNVTRFLEPLQLLILILTNAENVNDTVIDEYLLKLNENNEIKGKKIITVFTYRTGKARNASDMKKTISSHIVKCLNKGSPKHLSKCFEDLAKFDIRSDEDNAYCNEGKSLAETVFQEIIHSGPQEIWKANITPLQYSFWRKWSELKKNLYRSCNHIDDIEQIKSEMSNLRKSQIRGVSKTMRLFVKIFVDNVDKKSTILYFIEWLRIFLDNKSRVMLPKLRRQYNVAWEKLKQIKHEKDLDNNAVLNQTKLVSKLEKSLSGASFGMEHIFREMGQIYEAKLSANISKCKKQELTHISKAMAKLISYGQPLELLDGDASNIPIDWVNSILVEVKHLEGCERIMTLSVLGIQSSGKSTLLNSMFGLQFAVSAGRCTRGVYMQLVPLVPLTNSSSLPFDHVMIIDSEGLRAPELLENKRNHDNELATFVIGLGDITLLNIKGENTGEINDILQITVHAFLRLKAVNKTLDLRQMCLFVHQNVAAINANDQMQYGVHKLVEHLDKMTAEAAFEENMHDITCFNQVIQFDATKHVWYLPDLWQGDPPMAAANVGYSSKVNDLRTSVVQMALSQKEKSYKSMEDILIHAKDLWKGICAEDFVFSFKNSLEIKAYLLIEAKYKELAWQLESSVQVEIQEGSKNAFSRCQNDDEVDSTSEEVSKFLLESMDVHSTQIKKQLELFFENCDYQDIIVNWKSTKFNSMAMLCENLQLAIHKEIKLCASNRKGQIVLTSSRQQHEERLHQESIKLASALKGKDISESEVNKQFESIWKVFVYGIKHEHENNFKPVRTMFIEILCTLFSTDLPVLNAKLDECNALDKVLGIASLHKNINLINLKKEDDINVNVNVLERGFNWVFHGGKNEKDQLKDFTETLCRDIDLRIEHFLQEDNELGHRQISYLLHYVMGLISNSVKSNSSKWGFTFKTSYRVKVCVYISCYAQYMFETHNRQHRNSHGIIAKLKVYKTQVLERFNAYLVERKAEATAATLFSHEIKAFIIENVTERLTLRVEHSLMAFFPTIKYHLIIEILTDLVEHGCFIKFIEYIETPKAYTNAFISEKSSVYLFDVKTHKYFELALNEIAAIILDVRTGILKASEHCNNTHSIRDWINVFADSLSECSIERERLRDVEREKVGDFVNFKNYLESQMKEVETSVRRLFETHTVAVVKWKKSNPLTTVFNRIWGCSETCMICGETCSKCYDHGDNTHSCIQHRPAGVNGIRNSKTEEVSLSSCNFKIQSDLTYRCGVLCYLCNLTEKVECSKGTHPYHEYRTYLPSWDIAPSSDMEDTCKLWMWFMAAYRNDLADHYKYKVNNIPESWASITKEEALESLRDIYKGRNLPIANASE